MTLIMTPAWRSMKDAPRDRTRVLLLRKNSAGMKNHVVTGAWYPGYWRLDLPGKVLQTYPNDKRLLGWQPLPEAHL